MNDHTTTASPAGDLCVEVSAWRYEDGRPGSDYIVCNDQPERAQGYGVYVRNPLAFHIQDFPTDLGAGAAFAWADDLAAHLGCDVRSQLPRDAQPATPEADAPVAISQDDLIEAAACLWEAALVLLDPPAVPNTVVGALPAATVALRARREREGTGAVRLMVIGWAEACHADWVAAGGYDRDDSFDWDFVPAWLAARLEREG